MKFQLADASFPPLKELPLPRNPFRWEKLLQAYLGPLRVHLPMILCFEAELGYEGSLEACILSKNLSLVVEDLAIINKKLLETYHQIFQPQLIKPACLVSQLKSLAWNQFTANNVAISRKLGSA